MSTNDIIIITTYRK